MTVYDLSLMYLTMSLYLFFISYEVLSMAPIANISFKKYLIKDRNTITL